VIIPASAERLSARETTLGLSLRGSDGEGRFAYVFDDRIERMSAQHQLERVMLLGATIAHEVGHLLLPDGSHSPNGLMRGAWGDRELQLARDGLLQFTARQGELIRRRLHVLRSDQSTCQ
jgi:hypothetical protein